ncbi:pilus assembly protein PilM, partial [Desulfonatronospira sp.]
MFNLLQSKNPFCSLDLGSTWAKTVRFARKGKEPQLDRAARIAWSPAEHKDFQSKGRRIKQAWDQLGLRDKAVISSLAGHSVIVKRVFFEKSASGDLENKITQEAGQYIPFDISDVHLDYHILDPDPESENHEVILVATKKRVVQDLTQVINHSGLGLSIVDVDAFALSNCFEFNYPELTAQPAYLLDIGGQHSIFAVFWKNQPL